MWGNSRRWLLSSVLAGGLASSGCVTTGENDLNDALDSCEQICGLTVAAIVLVPCAIVGAAGCVMGGCTRCSQGPDPVDVTGDDTAANDPAAKDPAGELPPPATVANADMRY